MRIKMTFCYDGSDFYGYQIQAHEFERSIQDEIEKTLSKILNEPIKVVASGRTDRGVHAIKQIAHFDVSKLNVTLDRLAYSCNCLLNDDIRVIDFEFVDETFHARFSVKKKHYRYIVSLKKNDPFMRKYTYQVNQPLDLEKMQKAANYFIGEHSFHNFCTNDEDFIRTIYDFSIKNEKELIYFDLIGNGFRRYMVRMIIGTLIEIGLNRFDLNQIPKLLEPSYLKRISFKAPPQGLYLYDIIY